MWIFTFDYKFHYGNQAKGLATQTLAHISSEVRCQQQGAFIMMNDTQIK